MICSDILSRIQIIEEKCKTISPIVAVRCTTFNHGKFIRKTLDGFIMQECKFPFVVIVHDDASTDETPKIIQEYAEKYPDIILPVLEEENQYSKHDGSFRKIIDLALKATGCRYIAMCEGDDYWIDPSKLQIQIDFLENNPEYGMCFHNVDYYNQGDNVLIRRKSNYRHNREVPAEDIIMGGGGFCPTCSLVYRLSFLNNYPEFARNYYVGDYPLQIYFALISKVYYFNRVMAVYRVNNPTSWTTTTSTSMVGKDKSLEKLNSSIEFLENFDKFSDLKYHHVFNKRKSRNKYDSYFEMKEYGAALKYLPLDLYEICRYLSCIFNVYKISARIKRFFYERKG
ncbi:MAG: glycosyltransferase [Bacteroides sp.]|nr:glycosyltransferase [Bacteroides sp.]